MDVSELHERAAAVDRMVARDAASRALGIEVVQAADGSARARMTVRADMVNGHQSAHGGMIFCLADTAFGAACNSFGPVTVAAGAEITFVAPARMGDRLEARATVRTRFGRHGVYDVTVVRLMGPGTGEPDVIAEPEVIAEFRGRSHELRASP